MGDLQKLPVRSKSGDVHAARARSGGGSLQLNQLSESGSGHGRLTHPQRALRWSRSRAAPRTATGGAVVIRTKIGTVWKQNCCIRKPTANGGDDGIRSRRVVVAVRHPDSHHHFTGSLLASLDDPSEPSQARQQSPHGSGQRNETP
jgi:hypothetical protein